MGAQRTIACPHCGEARVTKASGRQALTCSSCGRSFLVRDAAEAAPVVEEPVAAPAPVAAAGAAPPARAGEAIGGVQVLAPASLSIGALAFPEDPPQPPEGEPPAVPAPPASPAADQPDAPTPAPAPVDAGPGRRLGYYGRILGK